MNILKENVLNYLKKSKENIKIYISSSLKNLDYYYNKGLEENLDCYLFKTNNNEFKDSLDINTKLIDVLSGIKNDKYIFIDINLAMNIFFDEVNFFELKKGNEYSLKDIENKLIEYNYEKEYIISELGKFSRRGDIIDIFSYGVDYPIRLDFFDVELEKIKSFDLETQKSFEEIDKVRIYSSKLEGKNVLITNLAEKYNKKDVSFYIENKELLEYHIETMILLDESKKEIYIKRYNELINKSEELKINITENRNYKSEIIDQKTRHKRKAAKYKDINELKIGDYVIHIVHGVGKYNGLEIINEKECISVSYADRDKLYIPVEQISRLEKYINIRESEPSLYKLGTRGFSRKKRIYREDIQKVAKKLIEIQAKRKSINGIIFQDDTVWYKEFEEKFEHNETIDQLIAINDVKKDMTSSKIMDRVICGDVGYGKTEVAMRAAFRAVESGYQVAILTPTTILAEQHYNSFKKRFSDFPVNIEVYSRLSASKKIPEKLIKGEIDILIGTHKILSDSVEFNNLGLLIIDEEQKFGVKAKEKLKVRKEKLDVLTLTATPIPRTLNLALLGIRDISIISTPPSQKLPIETEIIENISEERLKKIILKEVSREGQIFYVSNDVKNMQQTKKNLEKILPKFIKIEYVNGQLNPKEIKDKIKAFENEEFQVLLASTIIENGIDIPNVNTIIIENFTKLGLSQIYQLRGRVGRSNRKAYCYLLRSKNITNKGEGKEIAIKSIENINSGGYQISIEDMNIRGAGEILGESQSGAIESFGYDLYLKMLKEEINLQRKGYKEKLENVSINIYNNGYIPREYISEGERIKIYKRIYSAESLEEINELKEEIEDRFGKIPNKLNELLLYMKIKIYAQYNFIEKICKEKDDIILKYGENVSKNSNCMVKLSIDKFLCEVK